MMHQLTFCFKGQISFSNLLDLLPKDTCLSPSQVMEYMQKHGNQKPVDRILMDETLLMDEMYQRPFQYLLRYKKKLDLDRFFYKTTIPDAFECLKTLLQYCSIEDPSWSELSHFSKFLNTQLYDCERSYYLNMEEIEGINLRELDRLKIFGFKQFVVKFMIRMSQDFATPSLKINEDIQQRNDREDDENDLFELHQLRRRWESDFHPYLFFNADRISFSFVHFNISDRGDLCNPKTDQVVETNIMDSKLVQDLRNRWKVQIRQDFDRLKRQEKLNTLCNVFGVNKVFDPDPTYELTTDNVLKMLAIHMRFRCGIPVVIMGETGCGKTRMVEFMSKLKRAGNKDIRNMVVIKVHGGITVADIQRLVKEAVTLARKNAEEDLETILFLDEANTTEAIYAIKEIVCDSTVHGEPFAETGLKIVAACNPYRKHDDDMIKRMEESGLGFHVKTEDVTETFAGIPMRHLVYRVIPLPPSMQPLVWDFGQLNNNTEEIYIKQMVLKMQNDIHEDPGLDDLRPEIVEIITKCLSASQRYMREERDICSFVSLRDVERTIITFKWFYKQLPLLSPLIQKEKNKVLKARKHFSEPIQALMHALGVCYHVTLDDREKYRRVIAAPLQVNQEDILDEIAACQNAFIYSIELEKDIGRNEALTENVFMMVVCAELRIPLFLVGKPGSSKSLAKTIVTDAMQGRNSKTDLFKKLKQIHVSSFQCSAVSDADGIKVVFTQCARLQKNQSMNEFVAVVVLDEIGLAEDSPKMPLKVLHPLLENASTNTQLEVEPHSKVGFVGISNWALDPAKMNRGIFVTRGKPSEDDLHKTAEAIFKSDQEKIGLVPPGVIKALTTAYLQIYKRQDKEFFGLRDYYGLLKMLFSVVSNNNDVMFGEIAKLVLRNFSGYGTDAFEIFKQNLAGCFPHTYDYRVPVMDLIQENLTSDFESRFLLLLTNQYAAVSLLPEVMGSIQDYQVIFGSSFPRDNDYTEVCRNINRIKVCMETGRTVVLLNLRDLYESLYDALNQHYVTFAGQRYVDLGLGGHRVKCRIAQKFRLIVIEEKNVVYEKFPIPLINRLEKHVFEMESVLIDVQTNLVNKLKEWIEMFTTFKKGSSVPRFLKEDAFPGYTDDTPASALVSFHGKDFDETKKILLQTASLDGVCRLPRTTMKPKDANSHITVYMEEQNHDSLLKMLQVELVSEKRLKVFEVVSFSQILHDKDRLTLEFELGLAENSIMLLTLQQFQTERNFSERLDMFFENVLSSPKSQYILLIQCPQAQLYGNLIACAKYSTMNKVKEFLPKSAKCSKVLVLFLFTLERNINAQNDKASFTSFHSQNCDSLYVDELKPSRNYIAPVSSLWNFTIPALFSQALRDIGSQNQFLDFHRLINDSIPEAIAKLKDDGQALRRNRVRIFYQLCFKSNFSADFMNILGERLGLLMQDRETHANNKDSWIVEVACTPQALQEAGSFKYAVWLHLRKLTAVAIAKVVSILDCDNNLDVLEDASLCGLWLQIFECPNFFPLHWPEFRLSPTFYVKTQFTCSFPFFRQFVEHFEKQWLIVEERISQEKQREGFLKGMHGTKSLSLLDLIPSKSSVSLTKKFIHDLVRYFYKSRSNNNGVELETIENCLFNLFEAVRKQGLAGNNSIVEVYILYKQIQSNLQRFSSIVAVSTDILKDGSKWIEDQLNHCEFVAHYLALSSLVKKLHDEAPKSIDAVDTCQDWKTLVNKAKPVAYGLVQNCSNETQQMWTGIVFVEIFLDQLVPISATDKTAQNYLATLAPSARRLSIGARKFNQLSDTKFINIVTKALEGCIKEIEIKLLCNWQDIKCKSCRANKMVDPVMLPCKHYVCFKCIPPQQAAERSCAKCRSKIPEGVELSPVTLTADLKEELKRFQSACTSFFLEYLSTFCFLSTKPPLPVEKETLDLILERLVICDKNLRNTAGSLSDFGLDFVARSYILQLLMGSNREHVEGRLNNYLQAIRNDFQDKESLFDIYIHCDRSILQSNIENVDEDEDDVSTEIQSAYDLYYDCVNANIDLFNQLQHLDFCVKMQYIVQAAVYAIYTLHNRRADNLHNYELMSQLVSNICEICQDNRFEMVQRAIVKELCRKHGLEAFDILVNTDQFEQLIPMYLLPDEDDGEVNLYLEADMLVLCGTSYRNTKESLKNITKSGDLPQVFQGLVNAIQQSPDSIFQVFLALSTWTGKGAISKALRKETFRYMTERLHTHFAGKSYQQTFSDIAENKLTCKKCEGMSDQMHHKMTELLTVFCLTTLWRADGLLADLYGLISDPKQYEKAFLPTMPASSYFQVKDVLAADIGRYNLAPKAFLCPNGHLYFIGDCTRPNQSAVCPDCKQKIGGQAYDKLHAGNQAGEITEESQAGYKLKPAKDQPPITPERSLSKLSVCALRFCVHAAMLLGSRNGNAIAG